MSVVVNMQQRRTVAAGRQNQDPNKSVLPEKDLPGAKKVSVDVENSIKDVRHRAKNTSGRGRSIVLAALLKKKQAAEDSPPAGMKNSVSGSKLVGGSSRKNEYSDVGILAVAPVELLGNKLSISDFRKRRLDQEQEVRAPLSVLTTASTKNEPERDATDFTDSTPIKSSSKAETFVYTKRPRMGAAPPTPPMKSSFGPREVEEVSPSPPPPPRAFESSPASKRVKGLPPPEADEVADVDKSERRSPELAEDDSDPYGFNAVRSEMEDSYLQVELEEPNLRSDFDESRAVVLWNQPKTPVLHLADIPIIELPQSPRKSHGLMNLGNTCYMNVIIQCLNNVPSFVTGMERFFGQIANQNTSENLEDLWSTNIDSVPAALLKVFRDLKEAERYYTVRPTVLKDAFAKQQSSFWGCIQQDAHEFFCSLIDQVQEEVSSELKKHFIEEETRPKLEAVCPTTQNFSCSVRNNMTCTGCGNVSAVDEIYRYFCLALPEEKRIGESQKLSLESLLNLSFQEATMSRKCEKCGDEDTKAQAQILKLPHVLVLQLKRLQMDHDVLSTKVSAPVQFTSRLDIGPWCAPDKQKFWSQTLSEVQSSSSNDSLPSSCTTLSDGSLDWPSSDGDCARESEEFHTALNATSASADVGTSYRLRGVVNHLGFTDSAGHFLADVLDSETETWLRCDDSSVYEVREDSVVANEREAYMFFYVHEPGLRVKEKLD